MDTSETRPQTTGEALQEWREAERVAAVARRGKLAAETAASAAADAVEAAMATAEAAKASLQAATFAESSALKTATAARAAAQATLVDRVDADSESAMADVDELSAKANYSTAVERARQRSANAR